MGLIVSPTGKAKTIAAVHPNAGIEARYRKALEALIDEMNASVLYWMRAAYRANTPEMAQDRSPAAMLQAAFAKLKRRWEDKFSRLAPVLGREFAKAATERTDSAMAAALRRGGFTVKFKMTAQVNDVFQATLSENVGLIKSIASQHLDAVQGSVMRSVQRGGDLGSLTKEIEDRYGLTRKRAGFIARDQNAKATAVITAARQREIGITQARWVHSSGGRHPRVSHVKAGKDGLVYDVAKGALIDGEYIFPGQLPNCRCISRSIIKGFT